MTASLVVPSDPIMTAAARQVSTLQPAAGTYSRYNLTPSAFPGLLATLASCYQEFRFVSLDIKIHPLYGVSDVYFGYYKDYPITGPTSVGQIMGSLASRDVGLYDTVPASIKLDPQVLLGGVRKWYQCLVSGASEPDDYNQGSFFIFNRAAVTGNAFLTVEFALTCEFRGPTFPNVQDVNPADSYTVIDNTGPKVPKCNTRVVLIDSCGNISEREKEAEHLTSVSSPHRKEVKCLCTHCTSGTSA